MIATIIAALLDEGPQLFQDIATGEGGLTKIAKVAADLGQLAGIASAATHSAATAAPKAS
jgi:hypothetical protein